MQDDFLLSEPTLALLIMAESGFLASGPMPGTLV